MEVVQQPKVVSFEERLRGISARAISEAEYPPLKWAVPGLIPEGLTILAGRPKCGKSWLALDLALSIATGGKALGQVDVEQGDVLYCALEDSERRIQNRLQQVCRNESKPENLYFWFDQHLKKLNEDGYDLIEDYSSQFSNTRLIIIDTLGRVKPNRTAGEAYTNDTEIIGRLQRIAIKHQIALLIVHHTRKSSSDNVVDDISGTLGLVGAADGFMVLLKPGNHGDPHTLHVEGREVEEKNLLLQFDRSTCTWNLEGEDPYPHCTDMERDVLRIFNESTNAALSIKDIADELHAEPNNLRQLIYRMKEKDILCKAIGTSNKYVLKKW